MNQTDKKHEHLFTPGRTKRGTHTSDQTIKQNNLFSFLKGKRKSQPLSAVCLSVCMYVCMSVCLSACCLCSQSAQHNDECGNLDSLLSSAGWQAGCLS